MAEQEGSGLQVLLRTLQVGSAQLSGLRLYPTGLCRCANTQSPLAVSGLVC